MHTAIHLLLMLAGATISFAAPTKYKDYTTYFDVQAHRGGRGQTIENTLPSFAWGLIYGATSLELDNGLTKDGHVVVWHDENIDPLKCEDTGPVVEGDELYPYVGKYIANLTLAQLKTLNCGSERLYNFPLQLEYPGTKISTLPEFFAFVDCATSEKVLLNIESKVDAKYPNLTRGPSDFVAAQLPLFQSSGRFPEITYQSFDWRTLIEAKKLLPNLTLSALAADNTIYADPTAKSGVSPWLGGVDLANFNGTEGERLAEAAAYMGANILSPASDASASNATSPLRPGYVEFTSRAMVTRAHELGLLVKPWTVDDLARVEQLSAYGVDGIISDYSEAVRRWFQYTAKKPVAPVGDTDRILGCLAKYNQYTKNSTEAVEKLGFS